MSITYNWVVTSMSTLQISPTETDYVVTANYSVIGVDGTYTSSIQDTATFSVEDRDPNYIPYQDLTNDIVIGWIQTGLGADSIANIEYCIADQIEMQINPPVTPEPTPLPWVTP